MAYGHVRFIAALKNWSRMNDKPPTSQAADPALLALRAEIDALDDAMHDLLMRRAAVVARMAASRAKTGAGPHPTVPFLPRSTCVNGRMRP